jgi:hypothetical protein
MREGRMIILERYVEPDAACAWLTKECGGTWSLAKLLEEIRVPVTWIDWSPDAPQEIFQGRTEGYLFRMCFAGDVHRLQAGAEEGLLTVTELPDGRVIKIHPGYRFPLSALRFRGEDLQRLGSKLNAGSGSAPAESKARPEKKQARSRELVLQALRDAGYDPKQLPAERNGHRSVAKKVAKDALVPKPMTPSIFEHAWSDLTEAGEIMRLPFD